MNTKENRIAFPRPNGTAIILRTGVNLATEDPLTVHEEIIIKLIEQRYEMVKLLKNLEPLVHAH